MSNNGVSAVGDANVDLVRRALTDLEALPDLLAEDVQWHFYGEAEGVPVDHTGRDNLFTNLWAKLFELTNGAFAVEPVAITAVGDELVMAHVRATVVADAPPVDAVAVYRINDGRIIEAWDISSTLP
jgi:uncharacterized protein